MSEGMNAGSGADSSAGGGTDAEAEGGIDPSDLPEWLRPLAQVLEDGESVAKLRSPDRMIAGAGEPRRSAVLVLFSDGQHDGRGAYSGTGPSVLFVERAKTLRNHPGQPAFPGGKVDGGETAIETALREAQEETGLDPSGVAVIGEFPELYLEPTHFLVTPVLGWWRAPSPVGVLDTREVASVRRIPVSELVDPANRFRTRHPSGFTGPAFDAGGLFIWGFTAAVLDGVLRIGGFERAWDQTRIEPLPDDVVALAMRGRMAPAGGVGADPVQDALETGETA
jgi:8-oxo-dGTP pyrophosphatase MutT (NUDIX family)